MKTKRYLTLAAPLLTATAMTAVHAEPKRNTFNPEISVVLNGVYASFSSAENEVEGFSVGHEGERGEEGFAIDHTEFTASANIDDKFAGSLTFALAEHDGETEVELEEAYVKTQPGAGLPDGLEVKMGRAFWTLGYLNEHHTHADDFADRPLPYRFFFDNAFNDDGVQFSYVLPTDVFVELGGGLFRGADYPFGGSDGDDVDAWSAFARIGGDVGNTQSWRLGFYTLSGKAAGRESNDETVTYSGDIDFVAADLRYTFAPTGNPRAQEVTFQAEYFQRNEDGTYDVGAGGVALDESSSGWYAQGVYKFAQQWRVGLRYSALSAADVPAGLTGSALDADGHDPKALSVMADWTNSEFSRIRIQFNREDYAKDERDNQFLVQYVMSIGAHAAHKY